MAPRAPDVTTPAVGYDDLVELATNLRWTWKLEARRVFARLDPTATVGALEWPHQILRGLGRTEVVARLAADPRLAAESAAAVADLRTNLARESASWYHVQHRRHRQMRAAFFAAEFSLTDSLPIFAGGLGTVAGEMLKASSALGIPVVGVGLLYRGSSHQWIDATGLQHESWDMIDPAQMPIERARDSRGRDVHVTVELPGRSVQAVVYRARVGRRDLYLLDTDVAANARADRSLTARLYDSDVDTRFAQEIILGVGGLRALAAVGAECDVLHLNEGHSAFASIEFVRRAMARDGLTFDEALVACAPRLVFTTHTPVAAGHDYFPPDVARRYLEPYARQMGLETESLLRLGRYRPDDPTDSLCPTVLALRICAHRNGVSRLHGQVTREQWGGLWPRLPVDEVPIGHVTDGVHLQSWTTEEFDGLLTGAMGLRWQMSPGDTAMWSQLDAVDDAEIWRAKAVARARLVEFTRKRAVSELARRHAAIELQRRAESILSPDRLTIGFVGRFVAYKRPTLLLADPDRLASILRHPTRPVQIVFAGKAHPNDEGGKRLLRSVIEFAEQYGLSEHIAFIPDFDTTMDRALTQGADVWLNTPRRPLEACGVGGMKAGMNGALNLSTLDGWWDEAWHAADPGAAPIGFTIGTTGPYPSLDEQDARDAESLYRVLEEEITPSFYDRDELGLPRRWLASVKRAMSTLAPTWNSLRMAREYAESYYLEGFVEGRRLSAGASRLARARAAEIARLRAGWPQVAVELGPVEVTRGRLAVTLEVNLGPLEPSEVAVAAWVSADDHPARAIEAVLADRRGPRARYRASAVLEPGGSPPHVVGRVTPSTARVGGLVLPGLISWSD